MSNYATVGSNNMVAALAFYDELLTPLGYQAVLEHPSGGRVYARENAMFAVLGPYDGKPASVGNGTMAGFGLSSSAEVARFHANAIRLGAVCEGPPGPRGPAEMGAHFGYFRDLDGNKLCGYVVGATD